MPLIIFSEQSHVAKIWNGRKIQTTRLRGKRERKAGEILYPYFKSRMRKGTCFNCINKECGKSNNYKKPFKNDLAICPEWVNKFGTAPITKVEDFDPHALSYAALEAWAKADGFESFAEAEQWFEKVHGENWVNLPWDIIYFEGDWLI